MATAPLLGLGPGGWIAFGVISFGAILLTQKSIKKNNSHSDDDHNKANPNKKRQNGPQHPFYYHTISCKSKKDDFERAIRDDHENKPIFNDAHFYNK